MRTFVGRLLSFGLSVAVGFIASLLSVPAIIHFAGPKSWSGLVISQSVAGMAAILVGFGWNVTGPAMVANASHDTHTALLRGSLASRLLLFMVGLPMACTVGVFVTGLPPSVAVVSVAGYLLQPLGATWFFVGRGLPFKVFWLDTVPRVSGVGLGILALWGTGDVMAYCVVTLLAGVTGLFLTYRTSGVASGLLKEFNIKRTLAQLREQRHGVTTVAFAYLYSGSPPIIAGLLLPVGLDSFTLAYRLFTYAVSSATPFLQVFQGWIPAAGRSFVERRIKTALKVTALLSCILAVGGGIAFVFIGHLLSMGKIPLGLSLAEPIAISVSAVIVSQVVGLACLTLLGAASAVARSTIVGTVIGLSSMPVLAVLFGAPGLAAGMALTEVGVSLFQVVILVRLLRRNRRRSESS